MPNGIYNLDVSGQAPQNLVENELHAITTSRVYIFKTGACYTGSLKVEQDGRELIRGLDYKPVLFNADAAEESGLEVHVGILLESLESQAPLALTYQCVGGIFADYQQMILELIEKLGLESNMVLYGDIVGLPDVFAPAPHKTEGKDLTGLAELVEAIERVRDALTSSLKLDIEQIRDTLKAKVDRGGRMTLRPDGGSITVPTGAEFLDLVLPRSEEQTHFVTLECTFVSNRRPYKAIISYVEEQNRVVDVNGYYIGPGTLDTPLRVGATAGNDNVTVLRLAGPDLEPIPIQNLYVIAMTTTDETVNNIYGQIDVLSTPSNLVIGLSELEVSSGAVTTGTITDITESAAEVVERVDTAEDTIAKLLAVIDNDTEF